jgi:hypothetical protein
MELKKLSFKEIDKIDLSGISPIIDKKTSNNIEPKLDDIVSQNGDLLEIRLAYNNGWDRKSNGLTPDVRKKFLDADKSYFRMTNTNLSIHTGKIEVSKQAELYIKYKYYGEGNPVLWPGCSMHNWGLAVDLAITDELALQKSLNENGWKQTDAKTPWHFECSGSRDYVKAAKVIKSFRTAKTGLAFKWSEQVAQYYQKSKTLNKRVAVFNRRLQENKSDAQVLLSEIEAFNVDAQSLKSRTNDFNKDIAKFNMEHTKAKRLFDEIATIHNATLKANKTNEYNRMLDWISSENSRIFTENKLIEQENTLLFTRNAHLIKKIADQRREYNWLAIESKLLNKLVVEIEQHKSNATLHLKSIETQTWK